MFLTKEYGFDLGTTQMRICHKNKGVILIQPEVIAIDKTLNSPIAVGENAYDMFERAPNNIVISMPIRNGVVADFENMAKLLEIQCRENTIQKKSRVIVSAPNNISEVEKRAVYDIFALSKLKFKKVYMVDKPIVAALGCGIEVLEPTGNLIVDIGGGSTEISIVSLGGVVTSVIKKIGGIKFDMNIINYIKRQYNVFIGLKSAEKIKKGINYSDDEGLSSVEITGRDVVTGLPKTVVIHSKEVILAINEDIVAIVDAVRAILEKAPPELASDILDSGIYITGGLANIEIISSYILKETNLKTLFVENPELSVVNGIFTLLNDFKKYKSILFSFKD
jgi:rod shape-determining protein MreB